MSYGFLIHVALASFNVFNIDNLIPIQINKIFNKKQE